MQKQEMLTSRNYQFSYRLTTHRRVTAVLFAVVMVLCVVISPHLAEASDEKWKAEMVADALLAAPPAVTHNARIFAWNVEGDMILVRHGTGPYTCVASGMLSARLGKPPLPYPDPMCMDQNAWAFFQAVWAEKNPLKPEKPYPSAPGLAWMLAGMSIKKGAVALGKSETAAFKATKGQAGGEMFQMTPHIMIMPVPFDKNMAQLPTSYSLDGPLNAWIMAAGTPIEHLMVHFSADDVKGMMEAGK
jgi:hypothetical protein